ncbi:MAG: M13 family peptidase [Candidatus Riflebacteria bacterium]|nr:M13 family peptidase [Candidatus Riflebacteria bacterium]
MKPYLIAALSLGLLAGTCLAGDLPGTQQPKMLSGIDTQYIDKAVRPNDDFFRHYSGIWLDTTEIPADKTSWGAFEKLYEDTQPQLRAIIEEAASDPKKIDGSDQQKIGDIYASFMNEELLEKQGLQPIAAEMARIDKLTSKAEIPALIAHLNKIGARAPYDFNIHQDAKDSTKYIADLGQSGLGLPDRDYYLKPKDQKLSGIRAKYQTYIEHLLTLAGEKDAAANSRQIVVLETELAKAQWTKVENRDPVKTYNKVEFAGLDHVAPGYDWKTYLKDTGIEDKTTYVIVSQPSYFTGFNKCLESRPLSAWKAYFKFHLLNSFAPYLSKSFVDMNFGFKGTILTGQPVNRPRWKRGVVMVEGALGESLGKIYVARHFPPERKARMQELVKNLLVAYRQSIETLDWMSPQTKKEAQIKLSKFTSKIGYPNKWRDYSTLRIVKDDLVGNVIRSNIFDYLRQLNKLGKPIDREEWDMTPQTVNAYYNPELNEIVFPAAILQSPFFDANADDAVNYGGIGAVIGHEISHGFDDQGSQYDGDGNLRDWWTKEDHQNFAAKTRKLVEQYGAYSPLPGYNVNGELTLGENIADNSGLAIAYKAYKLSLNGKEPPTIDNLSGYQRLYIGWAQVWRGKIRDEKQMVLIKSDPHSPDKFRTNGTLKNQPGFYAAFDIKEGDKMYLPPNQRVIIW